MSPRRAESANAIHQAHATERAVHDELLRVSALTDGGSRAAHLFALAELALPDWKTTDLHRPGPLPATTSIRLASRADPVDTGRRWFVPHLVPRPAPRPWPGSLPSRTRRMTTRLNSILSTSSAGYPGRGSHHRRRGRRAAGCVIGANLVGVALEPEVPGARGARRRRGRSWPRGATSLGSPRCTGLREAWLLPEGATLSLPFGGAPAEERSVRRCGLLGVSAGRLTASGAEVRHMGWRPPSAQSAGSGIVRSRGWSSVTVEAFMVVGWSRDTRVQLDVCPCK